MSDPNKDPNDARPPEDPVTEQIVAYLDGELDPASAEAMATRISLDPKLRAKTDSLKRTWDALDLLPRPKPSVNFATKTVSQVFPAAVATMIAQASGPLTTTVPPPPAQASRWWIAAIIVVVAGFPAGYVGRALWKPRPDETERDAALIRELSLLKNARFYRDVDDMNFLRTLDGPEFFAEDD